MNILIFSEFIENGNDPNCYRIRYLTAKKMAEKGHHVVFVAPSHLKNRNSRKKTVNRLCVIHSQGLLPNRFRTGGFDSL